MIRRQEGKTSGVKLSQQIPRRHPTPVAVLAAAERRHAFSCQHPQREIWAPVFKARCSASFPACTHANLLGWPPACSQVVCQHQQAPDTKERDVARESLSKTSCWHTLWKKILTVTAESKWLPHASRWGTRAFCRLAVWPALLFSFLARAQVTGGEDHALCHIWKSKALGADAVLLDCTMVKWLLSTYAVVWPAETLTWDRWARVLLFLQRYSALWLWPGLLAVLSFMPFVFLDRVADVRCVLSLQ